MDDKFLCGIVLGMLGGVLVASNSLKVRKTVCDCQQQMSEKVEELTKKQNAEKEISLDNLSEVAGGAIKNVKYTPTNPISEDTKKKI